MNRLFAALLFGTGLMSAGIAHADGIANGPPEAPAWQSFALIGVAVAFFYLIVLRPEQKRRKAQIAQRAALKKGDKVTAMGIIGIVSKVQEDSIILRMVDGAKIEVLTAAITDVIAASEESTAAVLADK